MSRPDGVVAWKGGFVHQIKALVDLPASPTSPRMARGIATAVLAGWGLGSLTGDAELVVSELVSNALQHAAGSESYELELRRRPNGVRISLADGSSIRPVVAELDQNSPHGRGLRLIEAIAAAWGCDDYHGGKRVWIDLDAE